MRKYFCDTCHFIYDEKEGDCKNGVPPETPLNELCDSLCNRCQMKDLSRYHVMFPEYRNLEANYYFAFSGKWHIDFFLSYLKQSGIDSPSILEIGSGLGRAAYPLVSQGFQVTSVERSSDFVSLLQKQKWCETSAFELIEGDIFSLSLEKKFDVILLTDSTYQELIYQRNEIECLAMLSSLLTPNGFLWIETMTATESHQTLRKKDLDLRREIILESTISVSQQYFTYHHVFELFRDGVSKERSMVSRTLPTVSLESMLSHLPQSLEFKDALTFPKEGKIKTDHPLQNWTDGGYPLATSNPLVKKEIIILKNKGDL